MPRDEEVTLTADGLPPAKAPVPATDNVTLTADGLPPSRGEQPPSCESVPGTVTLTGDSAAAPAPRTAEVAPSSVEIPPSLYARFEQFEVAGRGGMGTVYKARDLRLGRAVAIKLLFHHDPKGGLLKEARAQARLRHPNVCEVFEAGVADQVPFIVMRYIEGAPLQKAAAEMSLEEKVAAVRDVALALHEAHRNGLIHRDVKPSNILMERLEDGQFRPLITDFGIARDLSDAKVTMADAVQGTPAFMAPEQAAGQTRSLDRRTDVYGLGATLYDVLAGRPPITADTVLSLLRKVVDEEATPLTRVASTIPLDLEAIVMKCLEKDPAQRFESARALAEDLQRFLDGDPVLARRSSWTTRLWKRARKHKGKVAVGTLALAGALSVAGLWARDRRLAGERADLARELGGAVREMELFLRGAQTLPLHDLTRERDVVRGRLRDIESQMAAAGDVARGPGEDALGRGYLALQEPAIALEHLTRARAAGESSPGLQYATGLAHVALYREALSKANRIQNATERQAYLAEIEKAHKVPAMASLLSALTHGVESPGYAKGLVALAEGHLDEALARAEEAFQQAPWLYEAKKLEGDVLFAMGSQTGHDKAFDAARTKALFERSAKAYEEAADIGRSDPAVHEAACDMWIQAMYTAGEAGESMRPEFDRAKAACGRAITASPASPSGYLKLAMAHNGYSFGTVLGHNGGGEPEQTLSEAANRVDDAVKRSPGDAFASYLQGAIWRTHALYDSEVGRDDGDAIDRSVASYEAALAIDPRFAWALNEECGTLGMRVRRLARLGLDPTATVEGALALCGRALAVDPQFLFPHGNILIVRHNDVERLVLQGQSPRSAIDAALAAVADAEKAHPEWTWLPYWRATMLLYTAEYELSIGGDPWPSLTRAEELIAHSPSSADNLDDIGAKIAVAEAEAHLAKLLRAGARPAADPALESAISKANEKVNKAAEAIPWDTVFAVLRARLRLLELRYRTALGDATPALAEAALAPIAGMLEKDRVDPGLYELGARAHEARADLWIRTNKDAAEDLSKCVTLAEKAVQQGPGLPNGLATLGGCRLRQARIEKDPGKKKALAGLSTEALGKAAGKSPAVAKTAAELLREARSLAAAD
ncbi:MAG: serine/threonine-protein kinase [Polyangiaceae bacterium]